MDNVNTQSIFLEDEMKSSELEMWIVGDKKNLKSNPVSPEQVNAFRQLIEMHIRCCIDVEKGEKLIVEPEPGEKEYDNVWKAFGRCSDHMLFNLAWQLSRRDTLAVEGILEVIKERRVCEGEKPPRTDPWKRGLIFGLSQAYLNHTHRLPERSGKGTFFEYLDSVGDIIQRIIGERPYSTDYAARTAVENIDDLAVEFGPPGNRHRCFIDLE